ncbi:MAG: TfoX/Sxy family protein [Alphaproteobacteria bacterium]
MAVTPQYTEYLRELFEPIGAVEVKRMFGGAGVFFHGVMIALCADEQIYLKSDAESDPQFEEAGAEPFVFEGKNGKRGVMSYRLMPDECYDDPDAFKDWARIAIDAAFREDAKKPPSKRKRK